MTKILLSLLALMAALHISAQSLYFVSGANKIYSINNDYTTSYICTANPPDGVFLNDIAISPTGNFYGNTNESIYEIDILSGTCTFLVDFPVGGNSALACSYDSLYAISAYHHLIRYNLLTSEISIVADLGFPATGDISFYKGNLIFTSYEDNFANSMIKAYNPETGVLKDIFCDSAFFNFWGLSTQHGTCDNETVIISSSNNQLFSVDFQSQLYNMLPVQLPAQFSEFDSINGLASTTEYLGSMCEPQDLANLSCSSLSADKNLKEKPLIYPNPTSGVLHLKNSDKVKKVTIYDVTGKIVRAVSEGNMSVIDISNLEKGMYLMAIEGENTYSMHKVIKK
ncbi:T9SS type A sorting domain-containing protein [Flavobacterium sp. RHBU_24]|uniref:T9SS type A sorting domain-containing protein n=1 Tax=Flavobacterium sp. RHBU_24 TaxID=3391185 RepID=UPI003984654B